MDNHCNKEAVIAGLQSDIKTIFKRMDEQLTITRAVYELTAEIRVMNSRLETMEEGQRHLKEDVDEIQAKPGRRWDALVGALITAIAGLVVGVLVGGGVLG